MTNNDDLARKLKAAAIKATKGEWSAFIGAAGTCAVHTIGDERCGDIISWSGFDGQRKAKENAAFIAASSPANILSLLAERTADKAENASLRQRVAELEGEVIVLQQKHEIDPRTHKIIDLEERVVELEAIAAEYGMKFQRAQDDLKKARILCEEATMRANRADFEGYSRAVREYGSKTVSVKLPAEVQRDDADGYWLLKGSRVSVANAAYYNEALKDVAAVLDAAGIKLEVGE